MKSFRTWTLRVLRANAVGYLIMGAAFLLLWGVGVDAWWSFWLSRIPSWGAVVLSLIIKH